MAAKSLSTLLTVTALFCLAACGEQAATPPADDAPATSTVVPAAPATMPRTASPDGARVFFISPANTATVSSPVAIEFGIEGMSVVASGVDEAGSGHHHLLVDTGLPAPDMPIPADSNHIHFGDASSSTELSLAPGEHTLQLLLGDHLHIPHDPPVASQVISITVE